ncbi:MAG: hypothetical protein IKN55_09225 [Oscillospiraceae bacterium]|nr:hypothetical protein [Oscillospiraceae bacterium]
MNEKMAQIKEVFSDEAFVQSVLQAGSAEEVQALLAGKGVEMSLDEIELTKKTVEAVADGEISTEQLSKLAEGGELSEDELESVAGGFINEVYEGMMKVGGVLMVVGAAWSFVELTGQLFDYSVTENAVNFVKKNITRW